MSQLAKDIIEAMRNAAIEKQRPCIVSLEGYIRKHPGNITVVGTFSGQGHPQNLPKAKGTCIDGKEHGPWADNYTYCITCGLYDTSRADVDDELAEQTETAEKVFAQARDQHHEGKDAFIGCLCKPCQSWRQSDANRLVPLSLHLQQVVCHRL